MGHLVAIPRTLTHAHTLTHAPLRSRGPLHAVEAERMHKARPRTACGGLCASVPEIESSRPRGTKMQRPGLAPPRDRRRLDSVPSLKLNMEYTSAALLSLRSIER